MIIRFKRALATRTTFRALSVGAMILSGCSSQSAEHASAKPANVLAPPSGSSGSVSASNVVTIPDVGTIELSAGCATETYGSDAGGLTSSCILSYFDTSGDSVGQISLTGSFADDGSLEQVTTTSLLTASGLASGTPDSDWGCTGSCGLPESPMRVPSSPVFSCQSVEYNFLWQTSQAYFSGESQGLIPSWVAAAIGYWASPTVIPAGGDPTQPNYASCGGVGDGGTGMSDSGTVDSGTADSGTILVGEPGSTGVAARWFQPQDIFRRGSAPVVPAAVSDLDDAKASLKGKAGLAGADDPDACKNHAAVTLPADLQATPAASSVSASSGAFQGTASIEGVGDLSVTFFGYKAGNALQCYNAAPGTAPVVKYGFNGSFVGPITTAKKNVVVKTDVQLSWGIQGNNCKEGAGGGFPSESIGGVLAVVGAVPGITLRLRALGGDGQAAYNLPVQTAGLHQIYVCKPGARAGQAACTQETIVCGSN